MSQAGFTPIQLYFSTTAAAVPVNTNLASGELAINITDGKLYYKDNTGTVKLLAGATAGPAGGSNTQVQFNSSGVLAGSANLTFNGTILTAAGFDGPINGTVGATTANTGAFTSLTATSGVISTNSASDALRITQIGSGNAILVEDSANPDSSPFVVTSGGNVGVLIDVPTEALDVRGNIVIQRNANDAFNNGYQVKKGRGTAASPVVVQSGDQIGPVSWRAYDGSTYLYVASIDSFVDGTPGTNDMPGRLVFSTTADGASSPTERMRINSDGAVGIGGAGSNSFTLNINRIPTATTSWSAYSDPTISATVTTYNSFESRPSTIASSFTVGTLQHYVARQGTIGATSAVTSQFGYAAHSSLTGAANNYGFYGDIASGTGRYNLYMAGTADNYMAGSLGIGDVPVTGVILSIKKGQSGATSAFTISARMNPAVDVTSNSYGYVTFAINAIGTSTTNFTHFFANQGTFSGTAPTNQYGFFAESTLTGATNNYGFYSNIASGTGRFNFYAAGTASNFMAGKLGLGTTVLSVYGVRNALPITGGTTAIGYDLSSTVQSDVTSLAVGYRTLISTAASAFTASNIYHFQAAQNIIGAGSTVTTQYGFVVDSNMIGATVNYGFYGAIASGTGRYNLYMAGTAENFLGGNTVISVTDNTNAALRITQLGTGNAILVEDEANPDASPFVINADGRVMSGTTTILTASDSLIPRIATYNGQFGTFRYLNDAASNSFLFNKSRGTGTTQTIVQSADALGTINFAGSDGTNFISSARIEGAVDGTPGVNDMPGRLVFSTTADGASTPTERFRFASAGQLGIGGANYGTNGQVLTSGGSSAAPTWTTVSGGGSPGGSNTQVQFNSSGSFAGSANFTFNGSGITTGFVNVNASTPPVAGMYYQSTATSGLSFYNTGASTAGNSAIQIYYGRSSIAATTHSVGNPEQQWFGFGAGVSPAITTIGSTASLYVFSGHNFLLSDVPYVFKIRAGNRGDNTTYTVPESNGVLFIDISADYGGNGGADRNGILINNVTTGSGLPTTGIKVISNFYGRQTNYWSLQRPSDPNGGGSSFGFYAQIDTSAGANDNASPVGLVLDNALVDNYTKTNGNAQMAIWIDRRSGSTSRIAIQFSRNSQSNAVGTIQTTNTATAYNTSSDYRLKENIAPLTGAIEKVLQLKPSTYTWKVDGSLGEGFIAHELQAVIPQAVSGEKDAEKLQQVEVEHAVAEVQDADGKIISYGKAPVYEEKLTPVYQGVDSSFLVATLTAAIQEQQALIVALTARVEALEAK